MPYTKFQDNLPFCCRDVWKYDGRDGGFFFFFFFIKVIICELRCLEGKWSLPWTGHDQRIQVFLYRIGLPQSNVFWASTSLGSFCCVKKSAAPMFYFGPYHQLSVTNISSWTCWRVWRICLFVVCRKENSNSSQMQLHVRFPLFP